MAPTRTSLAAALAALCLSCAAAGGGSGTRSSGRAPDFTLRDVDGRTVHLSDYLGKQVVLLDFWATWCTPCAGELPHLQRLYQTYRDQGFVVLAVAMDGPETMADVTPFARRHGLTFPVLLDEETRVVGAFNPRRAAPLNVLIARDGTIAGVREGFGEGDEQQLEGDIRRLLQ